MRHLRRTASISVIATTLACAPTGSTGVPVDAGGADKSISSSGGATGSGGATASGGATGSGSGGNVQGTGGSSGTGGTSSSGGSGTASGGSGGSGQAGATSTGGRAASGGATGSGGTGGTAGSNAGTGGTTGGGGTAGGLPSRASIISAMTLANDYFMAKWPDPGVAIVTDKTRPSNIWTRAVYYEGLMALYAVDTKSRYYDYAVQWGTAHSWGLQGGTTTLSADNHCAGQTYIDLYNIDMKAERLRDIKAAIDRTLTLTNHSDWSWIDALQMAMPVFAKLGVMTGNNSYYTKMYSLYAYTKNTHGTNGLYNKTDHLWWRDADFDPPYTEPNGEDCYWSRGNGWVYAALARTLDIIPDTESHRAEYMADFVAMSEALRAVQRSDAFWNVSLHDPTHYGGKETTGTSLFTYGMALGVRKGWLSDAVYRPIIIKAWNAMVTDSLRPSGALGWVQGTGKEPKDNGNGKTQDTSPVTATSTPDFEDYGLGCFLLAGSEMAKLAAP